MKKLYLGDYEGMNEKEIKEDIIKYYIEDKEELLTIVDDFKKITILIACNMSESYEENSFFLIQNKKTKKLYCNYAGHCSCMGYEYQWSPEECSIKYLQSDKFSSQIYDEPERKQIIKYMEDLK